LRSRGFNLPLPVLKEDLIPLKHTEIAPPSVLLRTHILLILPCLYARVMRSPLAAGLHLEPRVMVNVHVEVSGARPVALQCVVPLDVVIEDHVNNPRIDVTRSCAIKVCLALLMVFSIADLIVDLLRVVGLLVFEAGCS